jgi:signal recognition particle subunit SRP54
MFATLSARLRQSVQQLSGRGRITEDNIKDTVRQIRMALLEADVALPVAKLFIDRVRERALGDEVATSLNPGQVFVKIVHDELIRVLGADSEPIQPQGTPSVVLLAGLQGAGKTTTAGKLARLIGRKAPESVLLASVDVYRPAAREQLEHVAGQIGARYFASNEMDPVVIASAALVHARSSGARWLIVDTAGRLHVDRQMMDEVRKVQAAIDASETLFVLDSMAGQDAIVAARAFHETLPLTGIVLTKTDGDARGGAALSVREVTGLPIKFVGTGEKLDALEPFVPSRFASRILGMGDVVGLVEQVQAHVDHAAAAQVTAKMKRGRELNLEDFKQQLEQIGKMGGIAGLIDKIPGVDPAALGGAAFDERLVGRQIAIINSMTRQERRHPTTIDGSRKRRIAAGAGIPVQDVNRLLKQHRQLAKTMKKMSKGGMAGMAGLLAGGLPGGGSGLARIRRRRR